MLYMPEQYLFSPAAKKIFPSLVSWTGRMIYTKWSNSLNVAAIQS